MIRIVVVFLLSFIVSEVIFSSNSYAAQQTFVGGNDCLTIKRTLYDAKGMELHYKYIANNTFTYSITPTLDEYNNPINPTNGVSGMPTSATISFNNVWTDVYYDPDDPDSNTSAQAVANVCLSGVTFSKVGDYYFTITETGSSDTTLFPVSDTTFTYMISVRYATNQSTGRPDVNNLLIEINGPINNESGEKNDEAVFAEMPETRTIGSFLRVHGKYGELDDCYNFSISVNPNAGGVTAANSVFYLYIIKGLDPDYASMCENNMGVDPVTGEDRDAYEFVAGNTVNFSMSAEDTAILIVPVNASYSVSQPYSSDDRLLDGERSSSITKNANDIPMSFLNSYRNWTLSNNVVLFDYTKDSDIGDWVTGIFSDLGIYIILSCIVIVGFSIIIVIRIKKNSLK